jgi:hypothetical protein
MKRLSVAAAVSLAAILTVPPAPAAESPRPPMPSATIDPACTWQWLEGRGEGGPMLSTWAQDCKHATGHWHLRFETEMPGFSLWVDDKRQGMVLQSFALPKGAAATDIAALLPELRRRALIADKDDCIFQPAAIGMQPRTVAQFEIRPVGEALKAFEATPRDEVPEPPCGDYAWSTHGVRYFQTDLRTPGAVLYLDLGQDGTLFDPQTVRLEP